MTAIFIQNGDALDYVAPVDLPLGTVVPLTDTVGIAHRPIPAGALGSLALTGVFEVPRLVGGVIPLGKRLRWDPANTRVVTDPATPGSLPMGIAAAESGDTATTVRVRLG
jgi:predicted RecA/RadA family phage recombinase